MGVVASSFWDGVTAALIGAVVGGLFALSGAVFVMRRERVRVHRDRIYGELLPALESELGPRGFSDHFKIGRRVTSDLCVTARIAGHRDYANAQLVQILAVEAAAAWDNCEAVDGDPRNGSDVREAAAASFRKKLGDAIAAVESYSNWLETKFDGPLARARGSLKKRTRRKQ